MSQVAGVERAEYQRRYRALRLAAGVPLRDAQRAERAEGYPKHLCPYVAAQWSHLGQSWCALAVVARALEVGLHGPFPRPVDMDVDGPERPSLARN
jgi:hypothetical protein